MFDYPAFANYIEELSGRAEIGAIISASLEAADPVEAIRRRISRKGNTLVFEKFSVDLAEVDKIILLSIGKASVTMAQGILTLLGEDMFADGIIVSKIFPEVIGLPEKFRFIRGGHPIPDLGSLEAGRAITAVLKNLKADDLVLCLISGGGSALATLPVDGVTLEDIQKITDVLLRCGAEIQEINAFRKHLDRIKGGGVAKMAYPARLVTLILSDVIGSPLDVIASGPTVPDRSTFRDVFRVVENYDLFDQIPGMVLDVIHSGLAGKIDDTPKSGQRYFEAVESILISSNQHACVAGVEKARKLGFNGLLLTTRLMGEARHAGCFLGGILKQIVETGDPIPRPACIVAGGETTVTIQGNGKGGRNLEVALGAVEELAGLQDIRLLTLATDGEDALTGCAGAVVTGETCQNALKLGLKSEDYLKRNDSYHFFNNVGGLIEIGSTGTNVNDITFLFAL